MAIQKKDFDKALNGQMSVRKSAGMKLQSNYSCIDIDRKRISFVGLYIVGLKLYQLLMKDVAQRQTREILND